MARGLYSALGLGSEQQLAELVELANRFGRELDADRDPVAVFPVHAQATAAVAVAAIRRFEARVGTRTGATGETVTTPHGPAIEIGNRDHRGFGVEHELAAREVADALAVLLAALGATGVFGFTID